MRDRGTFNFSGNLEVKKDAPLEARSLVNSYADLVKPETWTDEQGGIWKYDCMLVSCKDRPGKIYQLSPGADYTRESSWILIGDTSELNSKVQQFINSKGAPNGLASLNESGVIPSTQLPSYVDDVVEVAAFSNLPSKGESGKIYIVTSTNIQYRWSGTAYVEISKSIALGETSSTAYPGDKGKATTDVVNSLSDTLVNDVLVAQSNQNSVSLTIKSITKTTANKDKQLLLADGDPILLTDGTPILLGDSESARIARATEGLYSQANDKVITINPATTSTAGVMSSSDKSKLDSLKSQAEIDELVTKLDTHISNKSNPHSVTKVQVGLGNVDNTSDANKPISTATQNALNSKFNASDGNALKQRVDNIPELIATGITVDSDNDSVNISLDTTSIVDGTLSGTTININSATTSKAGILTPADKTKIDKIITNGNGTKYLSDNGTYKEVQGGSADIESLKQYVNDSISSARSVGYMMQLTEIDASTLDENTWYPVTIAAGARMCMRAEVLVALDSGTKPSWSTHEGGFSTRKIWEWAPSTWGVNAVSDIKVYLSDFAHTNLDPVRGLNFLGHFDICFVFVRGGGKYHFYTSHGAQVILHTSTYKPSEASEQSVSPTTTTPKPINALDLKNYGKVIDVPNGSYLTLNVNRVGADAIDYINNVFGSKDRLKEVIMDIIENHQRYLFHSYVSNSNCVEPNNVYAYYSDAKNEYNLQYNLSYYTTNGPVSKRASFFVTPYDEGYKVEVTDLATNWATLDGVLSNANEFNFVDGEFGDRVWLNYRSRSGNAITANKIYIGNGQANGGFGEVHAGGFFKESDIRLKSNIVPLNHTLEQICNIPTVSFDIRNKHQIGTIAQDIENDFADIVDTDSDGMKSVDYCMLGVVAVEGIKLLKQEIEDLKKQVEELKNGR